MTEKTTYQKAYDYYCKSCERSNEKPVSFEVYFDIVPYIEAVQIAQL